MMVADCVEISEEKDLPCLSLNKVRGIEFPKPLKFLSATAS